MSLLEFLAGIAFLVVVALVVEWLARPRRWYPPEGRERSLFGNPPSGRQPIAPPPPPRPGCYQPREGATPPEPPPPRKTPGLGI